MLTDELHAYLSLAHAHTIGIEHAAVAVEDTLGAYQPIALECGESVQLRQRGLFIQIVPVEFQQCPQKDGLRVALQRRRA